MAWNPITPVELTETLPAFATGWTDVDLSGVIGPQKTLALIGIGSTPGMNVSIRRKGDTHNYYGTTQWESGLGSIWRRNYASVGVRHYQQFWAPTDDNGYIQWLGALADAGTKIKVWGYWDMYHTDTFAGSIAQSTALQLLDISSVVGARRVFVLLRVRGDDTNIFNIEAAVDQYGTGHFLKTFGASYARGRSHPTAGSRVDGAVAAVTNDSGQLVGANLFNGSGTINFDVLAYVPIDGSNQIVFNAAPPSSETELDLSPWIGKRRAPALLTARSGSFTQFCNPAFSSADDPQALYASGDGWQSLAESLIMDGSDPYYRRVQIQAETNSQGKLKWKNLSGTPEGVTIFLLGVPKVATTTGKSPTAFHSHWGNYSSSSDLPNVSGAAKQDSAVEVGDRAYVTSTSQTYQCTVATVGAATWTSLSASDDPDAIHDDENGEINALTLKTYPEANDVLLIEDAAATFAKKSILVDDLPTGAATDPDAIHDNVSAEISALTQKTAPVLDDLVLIEDSEASHAKKRAKLRNIPRPASGANLWYPPSSPHSYDDEFDSDTVDSAWDVWDYTAAQAGSIVSGVDAYDTGFTSGSNIRADQNNNGRRSWLLVQTPANSHFITLHKDITLPTNAIVWGRFRFTQRYTVTYDSIFSFGLYADDSGIPDNVNNRVQIAYAFPNPTGTMRADLRIVSGGSTIADNWTTDVDAQGQALEYFAIHKIGTTYHGWVGTAAGNWIYMGSGTVATALVYATFLFYNTTAPPLIGGIDFLRMIETDNFLL